jgi:predicted DNA repair protein MutK
MAGSSLLALIDDIATILDDVSLMTKTATKKTAGVLGDDLALNAQQVTGVSPARELPVVWAVAKGSLVNKAILVPVAVAISFFASWLVTPLLMFGGAFLCFEGFEKLAHKFLHKHQPDKPKPDVSEGQATKDDVRVREKKKNPGRRAYRFRAFCRNYSHYPWYRNQCKYQYAVYRADGCCRDDYRGCLWPGGRHCKAG